MYYRSIEKNCSMYVHTYIQLENNTYFKIVFGIKVKNRHFFSINKLSNRIQHLVGVEFIIKNIHTYMCLTDNLSYKIYWKSYNIIHGGYWNPLKFDGLYKMNSSVNRQGRYLTIWLYINLVFLITVTSSKRHTFSYITYFTRIRNIQNVFQRKRLKYICLYVWWP